MTEQRQRTLFPEEPGWLVFRDQQGNELKRIPHRQEPAQFATPETDPSVTSSALKRGALNTASSFSDFGATLAEMFGQDEMATNFVRAAEDFNERAEAYTPAIGRVENIRSLGDAGLFAYEVILENAPMIASIIVPGGTLAKVAKWGFKASDKAAKAVGAVAAFLSDVGIQTGESASIAREHGESPADLRVVGSGIGKAALDFAPLFGIARRLGLTNRAPGFVQKLEKIMFGEMAERGYIRRAARAGAGIAAVEMPTEVAQEIMNIALSRAFSEYEGQLTDEEKSQLVNAAAGAAAFGLLGLPAGVPRQRPPVDKEDAEREIPEAPLPPDDGPEITTEGIGPKPEDFVGPLRQDDETGFTGPVRPPALPEVSAPESDAKKAEVEEALEGEPEDRDTFIAVDTEGKGHKTGPVSTAEAAPTSAGPAGVAMEKVNQQESLESQAAERFVEDPATAEGQAERTFDTRLQKLKDMRDEFLADPDNHRETDGVLKKAAQAKLARLDAVIAKYSERIGIDPEVSMQVKPLTEETLIEQEKRGVEAAAQPGVLTERQKNRIAELETRDQFGERELTTREREELDTLYEIASGQLSPEATRAPTKKEQAELDKLAKEYSNEGTERVRKSELKGKRPKKGLSIDHAKTVLTRVAKLLRFGPKVRLLARDHPEAKMVRERTGSELKGYWRYSRPGEIVVVPENHESDYELVKTYLHETLSHYGLRTIFSGGEIQQLIRQITLNPPDGLDADAVVNMMREGKELEALLTVEEYIADIAEELTLNPKSGRVDMKFWNRFVAWFKRKLRSFMNVKWTDNDIKYMLRDVSKALSGRITPRNYPLPGFDFRMGGAMDAFLGRKVAEKVQADLDSSLSIWGVRFNRLFMTPLQFSEHYNIEGTQEFLEFVQQWWARKRSITDAPAVLAEQWLNLGQRNMTKLSQMLFEASTESDEKQRRLTEKELQDVWKKLGVENDTNLLDLWKQIDGSFTTVVNSLERGMSIHAIRIDTPMTKENAELIYNKYLKLEQGMKKKEFLKDYSFGMMSRLDEIKLEMEQLKNRNYFPRSRFGQWAITVKAKESLTYKGKPFKKGEVVNFETWATEKEQRAAFRDVEKQMDSNKFQLQRSHLRDEEFHFMGTMSPQLYEKLKTRLQGVDEIAKNTLKEIYLQSSPGRSFLRHLTKRRGISGYSEDALRVYASYMMNVANHISRVEYHLDMTEQLKTISEAARARTPDANIASLVSNYYSEHMDYLMNPKNDMAQLRAFGFLWYLGFNVKSAMVNLTQIPMVAHPYLASQYGDSASAAALSRAIKSVVNLRRTGGVLDPELREAVAKGVRMGFIEESRATEMAGLSEQTFLERLMPVSKGGKLLHRTSFYGAFLFQKAERINREITFIAAYNLEKRRSNDPDRAFRAGRKAVQTAMFEYAKWNRPVFMRGRKSVFFLFWQYMQGLSYIAAGGAGGGAAMRVWMMLLLAGGLQGLPFAENIMDLWDYAGTKSKEFMGLKDPRVDVREDLRELIAELYDRPDLVMHGLSRSYGAGPAHLLNMVGVPFPELDISGSISAGRVVPGLQDLLGPSRDAEAKLGRVVVDALGPVAGVGFSFYKAATDTNPDSFKVWERAMPVAMKNALAAVRRGREGAEVYRGGGTMVPFDTTTAEGLTELIAGSLGFAPTRLNQRYEADFAVSQMKRYWRIRRALIMEMNARARIQGDSEAIADARAALLRFNDSVPSPTLRISPDQLRRSLKASFRRSQLRERALPNELLFRQVERKLRDLYPEASVEI
jgi:hypothetical protein